MQEKAKRRREGLTARLQARDTSVSRRRLIWLFRQLIWGGMAYLMGLGVLPFDIRPLGIALLLADGGRLLGCYLGLVLSELMLMDEPVVMLSAYTAAALVRLVSYLLLESDDARISLPERIRHRLKGETRGEDTPSPSRGRLHAVKAFWLACRRVGSEGLSLRLATAGVSALAVSLYRIVAGGFRYYDLFAALVMVTVAPLATWVFSARVGEGSRHWLLQALSSGGLIAALVWSANGAAVAGIPISAVLSMLITLLVSMKHGAGWGAAAGALAGLVYHPMEIPSFLLAALVFEGIKWRNKEVTGLPLACLASFAWSVYARGVVAFTVSFPAYLAAGAITSIVLRVRSSPTTEQTPVDPETELRCAKSRHEDANDRFRDISEAFSGLSELFYSLSDRLLRPGTLDLRRICDSSFDAYCTDCPNKTVCWGLEYADTLSVLNALTAQLHTKGRVTRAQIPAHMKQRCASTDRILRQINTECARFTAELLRNNRTEIFAMDYEAAANIINDALAEDDGEYRFDPELETRLFDYLSDAGIRVDSVSVCGMRRRQILARGVCLDRASVTMETLRCDIGEMCGMKLGAPTFEVENNSTTMLLQAERRISVEGAQKNLSADGGVSGDSVNLFSNRKDFFYALISDGMGSGRDAAFTSNLCSVFLEKMLRAGNRAGTSLRMLNNLILSRCPDSAAECSSTVDLMELDLITGHATFRKGGAAPSFVLREGRVHRLQAGAAPIGILRSLETMESSFDLLEGDLVVMISDGIIQEDPDCKQITEYLSGCADLSPETIVEEICRRASEYTHHDDCSAIALRICAPTSNVETDAA